MPLQEHHRLISVDDHVIEHPRVWTDRLPQRNREAGPRIVEVDLDTVQASSPLNIKQHGTAEVWLYEGRVYPYIALNAVAGRKREDYGLDPVRYDQMIPGCYDPKERVKDIDLDGVQAQLCFPSFPRFAGTVFLEGDDKDLALLCVQAWNDFMIDEWCGYAPDRFIPLVILPLWDAELSAAEIRRTAAKGAKAIAFPENGVSLGLGSFHDGSWDPVFEAAQETDVPLCMHFGTSGIVPNTAPDAPFTVMITLMGCNSMYTTADLLFSPIFHKFDRLKVALSEGGVGWIPYILERADYTWERHMYYTGVNREVRPSDLFRKHIWGCFIDDEFGVKNRHEIGIDRLTWECDYPHSDSNWPQARKRAEELFAEVPDDEVKQIVEDNARKVYNFYTDLEPAQT